MYSPGTITDSVSTSKGDPTFCGTQQFAFKRLDTGGDASDMIQVQADGSWHIQPTSLAYTPGTVTIEVTVTLSHVDPLVMNKKE